MKGEAKEGTGGHVLVVDDNPVNRRLISRVLKEQGHTSDSAENGRLALDMLHEGHFDVVLLDVLMPVMDGYETLSAIKRKPAFSHIPVIIITSVDEMESALRCIELGATDYLPKPFNPNLLKARLNASLAGKRLRDLELEYLEQVQYVIDAASAVEEGNFELPATLNNVAVRGDALGQLARVVQQMAEEVRRREERLKNQVNALRIEIDEARQEKKVAEITETQYFQELRGQADTLRDIISGSDGE